MEHSAVSVKKQPYPLFKSLRLKKSSPLMYTADFKRVHIIKSIFAPQEHCMLQKWSYHQKHCRPFQHYLLQKSSYQTAVSPQSSNSLSQQPSKRGGWVYSIINWSLVFDCVLTQHKKQLWKFVSVSSFRKPISLKNCFEFILKFCDLMFLNHKN